MMMKSASKIMITFVCLYVFIAKTFVVVYRFFHHKCDYPIVFADMVVLGACVLLALFLWKKDTKIKYTMVWGLFLMGSLIMQIYSGLFHFLTKSPMVDQNMVLWIFDIPNLLSVFLLAITMIMIRRLRMSLEK